MSTERTTMIVSVNADADDEARIQQVEKQVGAGWKVVQTVPVEGSTSGPGGNTVDFIRLQVTLEREIEPQEGSQVGAVKQDRSSQSE